MANHFPRFFLVLTCAATLSVTGMIAAAQTQIPADLENPLAPPRGASPGQSLGDSKAVPAPEGIYDAKLSPGYLLQLSVLGVQDYSILPPMRVDSDGMIHIAGLKPLHVAGLSLSDGALRIADAFVSEKVLKHPIVSLSVLEYTATNVTITGEVIAPGAYPFLSARPLNVALGRAGGIAATSAAKIIVHHVKGDSETVNLYEKSSESLLSQIMVQPGDSVHVERAGVIYVMGAVNKSGGFLMVNKGNLDVYEALSIAGGMTINADGSGMRIFRPTTGSVSYKEIRIPFSQLAKSQTEKVELLPNDVLFVPRSGWKVAFLDGAAIIGAAINSFTYTLR
jgi:polysaccharide export outer membrane protein